MQYRHLALACFIVPCLVFMSMAHAEKGAPEIAPFNKQHSGKIVRPKPRRHDDGSRMLLSRPEISRLSVESSTGGNNIYLFSAGHLKVRITARDSGARIDNITFRFNGHTVHTIHPGGRTYSNENLRLDLSGVTPARSGNYDLTVRATNVVGQSRSRTIPLPVDLQRPNITSVTPHDGATVYADVSTANITFNITATDDRGISKVQVVGDRIHDPSWQGEDRTRPYRITIRSVEEGSWDWTIGVIDHQGNMAQMTRTLHVRRRPMVRP